ncbi:MAG: hypothetical protein LBE17_09490 [Treponema sp.]|nr:hypothetical protein [Treponema sp.]
MRGANLGLQPQALVSAVRAGASLVCVDASGGTGGAGRTLRGAAPDPAGGGAARATGGAARHHRHAGFFVFAQCRS